ncbi:recombinase family protein [Streptosporangium sp. OZ121]|uniref:recombinase family protein n=1 Tax=Streptosporangium sp. OZ121 TaxID=3444183 RepID=UPI003F793688
MNTHTEAAAVPSNAIRIGYARVSTRAQDHLSQMEALSTAHCREVVEETASTRTERPKLAATVARMHAGDTLVIYKPDRIARSVKELLVFLEDQLAPRGINLEILSGICAGLHRPSGQSMADKLLFMVAAMAAEMEREMIRERTLDGLAAATAQGRKGGRPPALDTDTLAIARARRQRGESITAIAKHLGVGRSTLYRALEGDERTMAGPAPAELSVATESIPAAAPRESTLPKTRLLAAEEEAPAGSRRPSSARPTTKPVTEAVKSTEVAQVTEVTEPTLWERYGDPATRRRWYTDAELAAVQLLATGDVDSSQWVIVAGDILGTVRPNLSARGTRSGWQARHRGGGPVYHLSGKGRGAHPATRDKAVAELVADVRHRWTEQRRREREA